MARGEANPRQAGPGLVKGSLPRPCQGQPAQALSRAGTHGHIPLSRGTHTYPGNTGHLSPGPSCCRPEGTPDCTQAPFITTSRTLRDHVSPCKPLETLQLWGRLGGAVPKPEDYFCHTH